MIIDQLAGLASYVGNTYFISFLAGLSFVLIKKHDFSGLIYLLFFTMIYNTLLKPIFALPLPKTCPGTGYGFPSGHMNFNAVFFLWIFTTFKNRIIKIFSVLLLATIGWSIVYKGFHFARDVLLTPIFSCLFIFIYKKFIANQSSSRAFLIVNIVSSILIFCLYFVKKTIPEHIFIAYYLIIGFGLSKLFLEILKQKTGFRTIIFQIVTTILVILSMIIVLKINNENIILYHVFNKIHWLFIGISISFFKYLLLLKENKAIP
ncbi:MAG: phosphatase PAP2 family protein [Holosporales bacterium]|nr:phosphatase PAP2 family protein [Holosporales bacterium]